jgi:hypothetical protein
MYTSNANGNGNQADILLQNNLPSCSKQDSGLREEGFTWNSNEDISEMNNKR